MKAPHTHAVHFAVYCLKCHNLVCCAERHPGEEKCEGEICTHPATNYPCGHQVGNYWR